MTELDTVRSQVPAIQRGGYFNGGYTGPLCAAARTAADEVTRREYENGRMGRAARAASAAITSRARANVARLLNVPAAGIVLTQHTTDGMNTVVRGLRWQPGDNAVTTRMEHKGAILPFGLLRRRESLQVRAVDVAAQLPTADLVNAIVDAIDERTRLVLLSHVSYVNGSVLPLDEIVAKAARHDCLVVVDGAQSAGVLPLDVPALGVDGYAISGQKWLCGPEGTGGLYLNQRALDRIEQSWVGYNSATSWTTEGDFVPNPDVSRFEVGTRSMAALAGFAAAIDWLLDEVGIQWIADRVYNLAETFRSGLTAADGVQVLTPANHVGLVSFRLPMSPDTLVERLEDDAVMVRSIFGFDCVRASVGFFHSEAEVDDLVRHIAKRAGQ